MDFHLSEEQLLIQQSAEEIVQDLSGLSLKESLQSLADIDFLGIFFSEEEGGAGGDFTSYVVALEEIAKVSGSLALGYAIHNTQVSYPISRFGSQQIKNKYLTPLCKGEKIGAYAYGESWAGKDMLSLETNAVKNQDDYILNGSKTFVYNGSESDLLVVFANTENGLSVFVVEADTPGIEFGKPYKKMGFDLLVANTVTFTDVRVPVENRIGQEGEGQKIANAICDLNSVSLATIAVGISQTAMDKSISYGTERQQFKRPILSFEGLREMIGKMAAGIEAARLLVYKAAVAKDNEEDFEEIAHIARYFAVKTGEQTCIDAIQIHGGYGYSKDLGVEVLLRDIKGLSVFETLAKPVVLTVASEKIG